MRGDNDPPQWRDKDGVARNDMQRALALYEFVNSQAPNYTEIDYELGNLYMKMGAIDKAIECYKEYARHRRFFTKIHFALAQAYIAKRDWENAEKSFDNVLELNDKFTLAFLWQSVVCRMHGEHELADYYYNKAADLSADYARKTIVDIYEKIGAWENAVEYVEKNIARVPADPSLRFKQGWLYIQMRDWQKAIDAFNRVVTMDSLNVMAYVNLSNLYYFTNDMRRAKETLQKAMAIDPEAVRRAVLKSGAMEK